MMLAVLIAVFAFTCFSARVKTEPSTNRVLIVPDDYPSIQEAVNAASPGDQIMVRNGTYHEWVTIGKSVALYAEFKHGAIVDGLGAGTIFTVTASNVNISGFKIRNTGITAPRSCIRLSSVMNCSVRDNLISNSYTGIHLVLSARLNFIFNNEIAVGVGSGYGGILLESSSNNTIVENHIHDCNAGLVLSTGSNYNNVTKNTIRANSGNLGVGITFPSGTASNYNSITSNNITANLNYGIYIYGSHTGNKFYHNNFDNGNQFYLWSVGANSWDNGYPSGGNYWSNYRTRYPDAKERGTSGIWDTPYVLSTNNIDRFPLVSIYPDAGRDISPPEIVSVTCTPACPPPLVSSSIPRDGESACVQAAVDDASGVAEVLLRFRADSGEWWNSTMNLNATTNLWTAIIPGYSGGAMIEFCLEAFDAVGNRKTGSTYDYVVIVLMPGDINGDGVVDVHDLRLLGKDYGETSP